MVVQVVPPGLRATAVRVVTATKRTLMAQQAATVAIPA
jgi:hypothetical protein